MKEVRAQAYSEWIPVDADVLYRVFGNFERCILGAKLQLSADAGGNPVDRQTVRDIDVLDAGCCITAVQLLLVGEFTGSKCPLLSDRDDVLVGVLP
jgi:hypothetical protein